MTLPHHRHLRRHKANGWQREESGKNIWVDLLVIAVLIEIGVLLYGWLAH